MQTELHQQTEFSIERQEIEISHELRLTHENAIEIMKIYFSQATETSKQVIEKTFTGEEEQVLIFKMGGCDCCNLWFRQVGSAKLIDSIPLFETFFGVAQVNSIQQLVRQNWKQHVLCMFFDDDEKLVLQMFVNISRLYSYF